MSQTQKIKLSQHHSNRNCRNWLIYDIGDRWLEHHRTFLKGVMYDFGCGERPYEHFFLRYVDKYVGVDWGNTLHQLKADIVADLNKSLPIKSCSADTIVSFSVLEHLCEPQTMLNEAYRILKTGGTMILQVPFQWWVHEAPYDYYRYTPYGLEYMFEKAGFNNIIVEPSSGFFTMWILKFIYFSCRFIRGPKPMRWVIKGMLVPFWFIAQVIAPYLDKLDRNWILETSGYYVIARKG